MEEIDALGATGAPNMMAVLNGVRAEMARRGISQREVADRLNVHHNTVNNWLAGRADPGVDGLIELMRVIGMEDEEILSMRLGEILLLQNEKTPALEGRGPGRD